jgi:2-methylcitrate dehydratase PrpD
MSDRIERFIEHLDRHRDPATVPPAAHAAAQRFLQDSLGVALAGTALAESAALMRTVRRWGRGEDARIWGGDEALPAPSAALVNAFHIHNQEFDCVHEPAVVHPMAVALAALLAVAERQGGVRGPLLTAALALAVDVATVTGMCATRAIRFFRPAQCGCLGATAGAALLMGLDAVAMRNAFGLAYSQLAGTMQAHVEGTPALALQVGVAARAAVCAVDLTRENFRGPHQTLDGAHGYFNLFEPGALAAGDDGSPFDELGRVWQVERVSHKPYPTGRAAQGGIAGLARLMARHRFSAQEVARITLFAPPLVRQLVDRPMRPGMSVNYARLCAPFLLATTLARGRVGLDAYRDAAMNDPMLAELAGRVAIADDGNPDANALRPQRIEVALKTGATLIEDLPYVFGAPQDPMSDAEQEAKFIACARHAREPHSETSARRVLAAIHALPGMADVRELVQALRPHPH